MKLRIKKAFIPTLFLLNFFIIIPAKAAIALDRTRIVFDGSQKSVSLNITNENKNLPYLAQGWIEDENGKKINGPLIVLPPVQRIEPGKPSQVKIQALPTAAQLPQDRESLYYFNLREIPPRSDKPNTLQIALQTRIKLFYRPEAVMQSRSKMENPWQEKLIVKKLGKNFMIKNPTSYYITIVDVRNQNAAAGVNGFHPIMISPNEEMQLGVSVPSVGEHPVITYINDYGGRPQLIFNCTANPCQLMPAKKS
ncbi:molecular chaperone [bacteria symbiont BFo1 of Frankliniella occidentalis]|nr:molecular chaperone [bacteria symbiont BFo1 of Frankliniella occidentalis]